MPAATKSASRANATRTTPARRRTAPKAPVVVAVATPAAADPAPPAKARKTKVLRDTFSMPKTEFEVLDALKQRAASAGRPAKKSEVLRAGVKALAAMGDIAFMAAIGAVPPLKPARAAKS